MRDDGRTVRSSERKKTEIRRKKQIIRWYVLLGIGAALILIAFCIRDIKAQMREMQTTIRRIEALQNGTADAVAETRQVKEELSYVSSIGVVNVKKPLQYTSKEVIQRLSELGQNNPVIDEISRNSSRYPEKLLLALANNPEMADFVAGYLNPETDTGGLTNSEKEQAFPLFLQWDPRWGYQSYGDSNNIGLAGCGPTCMSMVLYSLTRDELLTPDKIAEYAMENNYYVEGTGTAWLLMEEIPKLYDINVIKPQKTEYAMKSELDKGRIIVCAMGTGEFTLAGHFIMIYGYDDEGFKVNDPNCVARSRKKWTFDEIGTQIKSVWAYEAARE